MSEEEKIALFDAYLADELSEIDKENFELLIDKNEIFRGDFEAYQAFAEKIKIAEEYGTIKTYLKTIHAETQKPKKSVFLSPKFYIPFMAAAVIAILFMVIPMNTSEDKVAMADDSSQEYSPTTNAEEAAEIEEGVDSENLNDSIDFEMFTEAENNSENNGIDKLDKSLIYKRATPIGTSFLISEKGYFITAKHLVFKKRYVRLQNKEANLAFYAEVVYRDTLTDFAVLKCSDENSASMVSAPYKLNNKKPNLGDEVFTLGYPKTEIVYTKGAVSSANGFKSDSITYELSLASNAGNSGAPIFSKKGTFMGFIVANNSKKQSVTYAVKPDYIAQRMNQLQQNMDIGVSKNYNTISSKTATLIRRFSPFIFEVHED